MATEFSAKIMSKDMLKPDVCRIRFIRPAGFEFKAGQFVMVSNGVMPKALSIASGEKDDFIEVIFRVKGNYSTTLSKLGEGSETNVKGPYGKFCLDDKMEKVLLVAGGIGITPFLSMMRTGSKARIELMYSLKNPADSVLDKQITERYKVNLVCTSQRPRIGLEDLRQYTDWDFFICGPQSMVESVSQLLAESGVAKERIHIERW